MIISNKQIIQLLTIASEAAHLGFNQGDEWDEWARSVFKLLDSISNQQSEELKNIE